MVSLAWGATGWAAGTLLRSAVGAFALILVWTTIVQLQLDQYATMMPKVARAVYDVQPDAATNTVTLLFGQVSYYGGPRPPSVRSRRCWPSPSWPPTPWPSSPCRSSLTRRRDIM